jgi:hypothetical protein
MGYLHGTSADGSKGVIKLTGLNLDYYNRVKKKEGEDFDQYLKDMKNNVDSEIFNAAADEAEKMAKFRNCLKVLLDSFQNVVELINLKKNQILKK